MFINVNNENEINYNIMLYCRLLDNCYLLKYVIYLMYFKQQFGA